MRKIMSRTEQDILVRLENAGSDCTCYASCREHCGCGADWCEDDVLEAAVEIRYLRDQNELLLSDLKGIKGESKR
jgi:ferredoxin